MLRAVDPFFWRKRDGVVGRVGMSSIAPRLGRKGRGFKSYLCTAAGEVTNENERWPLSERTRAHDGSWRGATCKPQVIGCNARVKTVSAPIPPWFPKAYR